MSSKKTKLFPGGSASSNPTSHKFRDKARETLGFSVNKQQGSLSVAALARHDAMQDDDDVPKLRLGKNADAEMEGAEDGPGELPDRSLDYIFGAVRRLWRSPMESHKEACAVLAAVTESIRAQGGQETPTAYWAALMSTLELSNTLDEEKAVTAITFLLQLVYPHLPAAVVKGHFSRPAEVFMQVIATFAPESTSQALMKSVIFCLIEMMKQLDPASWSDSSSLKVLHHILAFITDSRPKIRKAAQTGITELVQAVLGGEAEAAPPAFVKAVLEALQAGLQQPITKDDSSALYILAILHPTLAFFPVAALKGLVESVLKILRQNIAMASMLSMACLEAYFKSPRTASKPGKLLHQLLSALVDYQPAIADSSPRSAWNNLMAHGYVALAQTAPDVALVDLASLIPLNLECFLSNRDDLVKNAADNLVLLLENILPAAQAIVKAAASGEDTPVGAVVEALASGLKYKFQAKYHIVLRVMNTMFAQLGGAAAVLCADILSSLLELHDTANLRAKPDIEATMAAALKAMGPEAFLRIIPLNLDTAEVQSEFPRAWILPLLTRNVTHAPIGFYVEHFLPLSKQLDQISEEARGAGQEIIARTYHTLFAQVWELFVAFCTNATDISKSFKLIAKVLGTVLGQREDVRITICRALVQLIKTAEGDEDKAAVAAFSKNFLPVLFNAYTSAPNANDKQIVLDTISAFVGITDPQLLSTFFKNVIKKLLETSTAAEEGASESETNQVQASHDMMDLALCMLSAIDAESVTLLYRVIKPQIQGADATLQKKSYRALQAMCSEQGPGLENFVAEHSADLCTLLPEALMSSSSATKQPRLRCLEAVIQRISPADQELFAQAIIAEAILCTKEVNEKTREAAYQLLVAIGNAAVANGSDPETFSLDKYCSMVSAGLGGSTSHMVSGAVLAMSRIFFEFRTTVSAELLHGIIDAVLTLLSSRTREVLKSVLGFVKVLIAVLPKDDLREFVPTIVQGVTSWKEDNKGHFRQKFRVICERLIRKFGYDPIFEMFPESDRKLLVHIKKEKDKQKKAKQERYASKGAQAAGDGDVVMKEKKRGGGMSFEEAMYSSGEESEDDSIDEGMRKAAASKSKMWIREEGDEALDLLDPRARGRIQSSKPAPPKKSVAELFKTGKDGRMIINESEEEDGSEGSEDDRKSSKGKGKKGGKRGGDSDEMDVSEEEEGAKSARGGLTFGRGIHRDRKPQKRGASDDEEEEEDAVADTRSQKSGGREKRPGVTPMGSEFRAQRAGGDVKKKGSNQDPFAYLPFNSNHLNKRKRAKAVGEFKKIVKGAKKGVEKGRKGRRS